MLQLGEDRAPKKRSSIAIWGIVVREKIPIVHSNWKDVLESLKDLVLDDILVSQLNMEVYLFFWYHNFKMLTLSNCYTTICYAGKI